MAALEHVLLTIDLVEGYCSGHSAETFAKDKNTIKAVSTNVRMISRHAEKVSVEDRMRCPSIPWAFLRTLEPILDRFHLEDRPYMLWNLVHERLLDVIERARVEATRARQPAISKIG